MVMTTPKGRPSVWGKYTDEWVRLYTEEKLTLGEIARKYGASTPTVHRLLHGAEVTIEHRPRNPNAGRTAEAQAEINARISATKLAASQDSPAAVTQCETRTCKKCGKDFPFKSGQTGGTYCSRKCNLQVVNQDLKDRTEAAYYANPVLCPCKKPVSYVRRHQAKYCSSECRAKYQAKRLADPANYRTFTCQSCGISVTRLRVQGQHKYCSNPCAQKHTKTKKHIVVDDSTVLDPGWEGLFWTLCGFEKIAIERFDREHGVAWRDGGWYAPDFWLPALGIAVEVKGHQDPDDQTKWAAFREKTPLAVIQKSELDALRRTRDARAYLTGLAY